MPVPYALQGRRSNRSTTQSEKLRQSLANSLSPPPTRRSRTKTANTPPEPEKSGTEQGAEPMVQTKGNAGGSSEVALPPPAVTTSCTANVSFDSITDEVITTNPAAVVAAGVVTTREDVRRAIHGELFVDYEGQWTVWTGKQKAATMPKKFSFLSFGHTWAAYEWYQAVVKKVPPPGLCHPHRIMLSASYKGLAKVDAFEVDWEPERSDPEVSNSRYTMAADKLDEWSKDGRLALRLDIHFYCVPAAAPAATEKTAAAHALEKKQAKGKAGQAKGRSNPTETQLANAETIIAEQEKVGDKTIALMTQHYCDNPACFNSKAAGGGMCYVQGLNTPDNHWPCNDAVRKVWISEIDKGRATVEEPGPQTIFAMHKHAGVQKKANRAASKVASSSPQKNRSPAKGGPTFNILFGEDTAVARKLSNIQVSDGSVIPSSSKAPASDTAALEIDDDSVAGFFEWCLDHPRWADSTHRAMLETCQAVFLEEEYTLAAVYDMTPAMYKDDGLKKGWQSKVKKAIEQYSKEAVESHDVAAGRAE